MDIPDIDTSQSGNSVEDIPGIDISQPDSDDLPIELNTPQLDESAACDPDLDVPLDSQVTSGDDSSGKTTSVNCTQNSAFLH